MFSLIITIKIFSIIKTTWNLQYFILLLLYLFFCTSHHKLNHFTLIIHHTIIQDIQHILHIIEDGALGGIEDVIKDGDVVGGGN
jgi:hypothetical protein